MDSIAHSFAVAFRLILSLDADLVEIVSLSLQVSLSALVLACVLALPTGAWLAVGRFPLRGVAIVFINSMMGLPPVVVGLVLYVLLSRSGPFGGLNLLYSPTAMIIAQVVLITPIVTALSCQAIQDLYEEYSEQLDIMGAQTHQRLWTLLYDGRYSLITAALAGFGRAIAEVGAIIIVGGNIDHLTRVMTTTIALETSKGNLEMAMALGIILVSLSILINALVMALRAVSRQRTGDRH